MIWPRTTQSLDDGTTVECMAPLIISASRSTDIPAYYFTWLLQRLQRGYVRWINPFNRSAVVVSFAYTRLFVFWTKNAAPMLERLDDFDRMGFGYYVQYTLNDYQEEGLETRVPALQRRLDSFRRLADRLGPERVVWRHDPMLVADQLDVDSLLERVGRIGDILKGYTRQFVFSFVEIHNRPKVRHSLARHAPGVRELTEDERMDLARGLLSLNGNWGYKLRSCAVVPDLTSVGIQPSKCVDDDLMARLYPDDRELMAFLGCDLDDQTNLFVDDTTAHKKRNLKDRGQRDACGCIVSKDIGQYDTCAHLCRYCYANLSEKTVLKNLSAHRDGTIDTIAATTRED